jgi:hypothetical protein
VAAFFIKIRTADAAKAVIEEARNEHRLFRNGNSQVVRIPAELA